MKSLTRRTVIAVATTLVITVGAAGVARAAMSDPVKYRLATATTGATTASLTEVATVSPVGQSTLSFPVGGQVAAVDVRAGQRVTDGQVLATLNNTALSAQRADASAAVASAQAKLAADQARQTAASTTSSSTATGSTTHSTASTATHASTAADAAITALQHTLLARQRVADAALAAAKKAVGLAATACQATTPPSSPQPSPSSSPSPAPSASTEPTAGDQSACTAAEAHALTAETATYHDQVAAARAISALNTALAKRAATLARSSSSSSSSAQSSSSSRSSGSTTQAVTAEQLAADQSSVDAAVAAENAAQQNLDQTVLRSTAPGLVEAVTLTVGDQISATSTTETVVISDSGGREAVADVPVADIASVAVGQRATVTPDGTNTNLTGKVTLIAALPASGSTVTYPVTVVLDGTPNLPDGSSATVTLLTGSATGAVVVPTSAVTSNGRRSTVQVDDHGTLTTVPVVVGTSGPVYTSIVSGLQAGQQVVLANLATPIPTSTGGVRGLGGGGGAVVRAGG